MSKRVDSHGVVYAPHNSTDACSIGTESNNLHVNVKGDDYIQIGNGDKVKFTKAVDFTGVAVTGIQTGGGITDTLELTSAGNDTVKVKNDNGKFKVENVSANGTVEQFRMDVSTGASGGPELVVDKARTGKVSVFDANPPTGQTVSDVFLANDDASLRVGRDVDGITLMHVGKEYTNNSGTYTSPTTGVTVGDETNKLRQNLVREPEWSLFVNNNLSTNINYGTTLANGEFPIESYGSDTVEKEIASIDRILYSNEIVTPFKRLVVEGGLHRVATGKPPQDASNPQPGEYLSRGAGRSADSYSTTFKNPIVIHEHQHDLFFDPSAPASMLADTTRNNTFTCDCSATFNGSVSVDNKQLRVPDYYLLYFGTNTVTPHTTKGASTVLISNTDSWLLNGATTQINTLPTGRYKVLISQTGTSNQNGLSGFGATFDLIVNTSNNDTDGSPVLDIGASFHHLNSVHGKPKIEYEILANGAWKVHLLFDVVSASHTNDHFEIVPKIRQELW